MQAAKATVDLELACLPEPVDDELPLQATVSTPRAAAATMTAALRAIRAHARRCRRITRPPPLNIGF
jgi:hypothetical protein